MLADLRHFGDLLRRNAHLYADDTGLVDDAGGLTWRELYERSLRLGDTLRRRGLVGGDRVGILAENSLRYVEALFALANAGLVAVPLNTRLRTDGLADILEDCGARGLLVGERWQKTSTEIGGRVETLDFVAGVEGASAELPSIESLIEEGNATAAWADEERKPDDPVVILYTSGTTGFPKGVVYTHQSALWATLIHVLAIRSARRHRVLLPSPLFSAAGFAGIACAVAAGSYARVLRFSVDAVLEAIPRDRITFTNLVPTTVRMLLDHPDFDSAAFESLEVLLYGGSPMPESTLRRADDELGCGFRQTFATSETGLAGSVLEPEDHRLGLDDPTFAQHLRSCGKAQIGVGVRLVDETGDPVPTGEVGEVSVACPGNMVGYWNRPDLTQKVLNNGWLSTGDLARFDADGFLYLVDRKHDMIVTGALNVYPTEVERVLRRHPGVADCAVIGVPHPKWGEAVKALVVARAEETVTAETLLQFARENLDGHKRPKSVDFVDEIPHNPAGKPLRRILREHFVTAKGRDSANAKERDSERSGMRGGTT